MANSGANIPGYMGHVPYKCEFPGHTTCESNRGAEHAFRETAVSGQKVGEVIRKYHAGSKFDRSNAINTR
jgi:hypothetical protein